ncbi:MAG: beta-N-acetylhexosaminidase [Deltaproteobacteria bacterium]|nr:beta-N-acetylhexosaminidase [Deltaproteobacteria bacterium]
MKRADELAGGAIIAGFDGLAPTSQILEEARCGALGGVVLFTRNVESPAQIAALIHEVRSAAPVGGEPLVAIDQEGGRVVRIREPLTVLPSAQRFGEVHDPELTRLAGRLVGRELRALGLTLNFAPVLDVDTNPDSPVIGDRSYDPTPERVVRHGLAFARGLIDGGIHPCGKHFPGHGDASVDSHLALPRVEHDRARLDAVELTPFRAWCREGLGPLMSAHVVFTAIDGVQPATLSGEILTELLRERLGFSGAVFTDDLEMGAIGESGGAAKAALCALVAGADGLLVCRGEEVRGQVRAELARAAADDSAIARRLEQAGDRLRRLATPPGDDVDLAWIGSPDHELLRAQVLDRVGVSR